MCRGTTNWEDVYIIKMSRIPKKTLEVLNVNWIAGHGGIPVDACIGEEVEELIKHGIITGASCCGHGKWNAHVLIPYSEKEKIECLGYKTTTYDNYSLQVNLKSGTQI